jgi:hypothetical protein
MCGPTDCNRLPVDVPAEPFEITYAAHTTTCTFLLDSEGVCRRIVMAPHVKRKETQTAARCVGAQYVASLDAAAAGCLVEMPRIGAAMLFARVDDRGRVSLVRTGPCTQFEQTPAENPFDSVSVKTSAPEITPRTQPPRTQPSADHEPEYFDAEDRTVRIQALRPDQHAGFDGDEGDMATAEYAISSTPRKSHPAMSSAVRESSQPRSSTPAPRSPDAMPTLRNPRRDGLEEEENPYAKAVRGMLPQSKRDNRDSARQRAVEALSAFTRRRGR